MITNLNQGSVTEVYNTSLTKHTESDITPDHTLEHGTFCPPYKFILIAMYNARGGSVQHANNDQGFGENCCAHFQVVANSYTV